MAFVGLHTPLSEDEVRSLRAGMRVLITGVLYTARDMAHSRMVEAISSGEPPPFDLEGQIIYYVGPTPPRPKFPIGSAGPTTGSRMDPYTPKLLALGLRGTMGKGERGKEVIEAMKRYGAVYFAAVGGAGALLARHIKDAELVAYPDLGPEAIYRLYVEEFPALIAQDAWGRNIYRYP
ncbi:MAG TPA: TRZ/ATZ family protein [Candidatus Latescibacteria bacterium]|nr:TRZ/ATZ family protein [Candidatus Latescibacterota bacterium]